MGVYYIDVPLDESCQIVHIVAGSHLGDLHSLVEWTDGVLSVIVGQVKKLALW